MIEKINKILRRRSFSISDQIFFSERLSLLLNSGIGAVNAISIIMSMDMSKKRRSIYESMISNMEKGMSLSRIIKNENIGFNRFLIILIQNGEMSGNLSNTLLKACTFLEKKSQIKNKIIGAMIYPIFIIVFTLIMTLFLILYIFPKITPLINSLNIELPLMTKIVQGIYLISTNYGLYILFSTLFLSILIWSIYIKSDKLKIKVNIFLINIPIIGRYIKMYSVLSLCYMGEILLNSGHGMVELFEISAEYSVNIIYKIRFLEIKNNLVKGISVSNAVNTDAFLFPPLFTHMCELGEKIGNLPYMLSNCAKVFDQEIDNTIKKFTSLIEPTLMVFMGLIVGSIALSIILPIYEITNHLGK